MGHGEFDQATGRGALVMAKEDGSPDLVSGEDLGRLPAGRAAAAAPRLPQRLQDGGDQRRAAAVDPFAGIATALIQAGLPAVVAMQFPISDQAAIAFSETFYQSIAQGDPVDVAMAEGRKKLWQLDEWATPVLFLRSKDGVLFEAPRRTVPAPLVAESAAARERRIAGARRLGRRAPPTPRASSSPRPREALAPRAEAALEEAARVRRPRRRHRPARRSGHPRRRRAAPRARGRPRRCTCSAIIPGGALDDDDADTLRTYPLQELDHRDRGAPLAARARSPTPSTSRASRIAQYAERIESLIHMPRDGAAVRAGDHRQEPAPDRDAGEAGAIEGCARRGRRRRGRRARRCQTALVDLHHTDFEQAQDLLRSPQQPQHRLGDDIEPGLARPKRCRPSRARSARCSSTSSSSAAWPGSGSTIA